jgi:hypothetical protein
MTRRILAGAAAISVVCLAQPSATTVVPIRFEDLVKEAITIVRGEVVAVRAEWRDRTTESPIVTKVTVRVDQVLKGTQRPLLELEFLGGTIGDLTLSISDMPQFKVGERDFLFVNDAGRPASPLVGFVAGRWPIQVDALTGREFVLTADRKPLTSMSDVDSRPAQSLSTMRHTSVALSASEVAAQIRHQVRR